MDRIKALLFGNEKKALDAITRRLEIPESRTADISDVLPEAILSSYAKDTRLIRALEEPVEECIKSSIRRDPEDFASALFPIMGPAIRKSIADALRSLIESLNQTIENSLSIRTRYDAWRAGAPLGEYILQRNLVYRVEQAFLIKRSDGLLIEHVHHDGAISKDTDAVSAMFTAIQDFISDSFEQNSGESLTTAVLGDLTLWAIHGPHAILVCVVRGVAPSGIRTDLTRILERIHLEYGNKLEHYDGAGGSVAGIRLELEKCLVLERLKDGPAKKRKPYPALIVLALLFAALFWWMGHRYANQLRLEHFEAALVSTPGIVVNDVSRVDGMILVRGMRDPLSGSPMEIAPGSHIDPAKLNLQLAPYQSLDSPIVELRARRILKPPPGVGLHLEGQQLKLSGSASVQWKQFATQVGAAIPGVDHVDLSAMSLDDDDLLRATRLALDPPATVDLTVDRGILRVAGVAPAHWLETARSAPAQISGINSVDLSNTEPEELTQLRALLGTVDGKEIYFSVNETLRAGQDVVLTGLARQIMQIGDLAARLGYEPEVVLTGYSDGIGTAEVNAIVEAARVDRVAAWLLQAGISPSWVQTQRAASGIRTSAEDASLRKVEIRVGVNTETGVQ